jgi:pyrroloquinoline quinone (PQQ) biosynthesis protein C
MLDTIEDQPLALDEFRNRLLAASAAMRAEDTRLYQLLKSGRCPPRLIRAYSEATVLSAEGFCATLSSMVSRAPDPQSRLALLENLLEEEGVTLAPDGLRHRPETSHPALARRFARAAGGSEQPLAGRDTTAGVRPLLDRGEWVEAVAYLLIGQELRFADAAPAMAEALEAAGIARHDVAFFWVHKTADLAHGDQALEIVLRSATGRWQQERCIAEASAGARAWMDAHGGPAHDPARMTPAA